MGRWKFLWFRLVVVVVVVVAMIAQEPPRRDQGGAVLSFFEIVSHLVSGKGRRSSDQTDHHHHQAGESGVSLQQPSQQQDSQQQDSQQHSQSPKPHKQPLLLIGAGYGRTGTDSWVAALERLGLQSYHMAHGVWKTPGHLELWEQLAERLLPLLEEEQRSKNSSFSRFHGRTPPEAQFDQIIDGLATAGFHATADVPAGLFFLDFVHRYPKAKVVLTVRAERGKTSENNNHDDDQNDDDDDDIAEAHAWANSMLQTNAKLTATLCHRRPYTWMPWCQKFCKVARLIRTLQHLDDDDGGSSSTTITDTKQPQQGTPGSLPSHDRWVQSYRDWKRHVISAVQPPERLLVFSGDGWEPLCAFVADLDNEDIAARCHEILARGEPYPVLNQGAAVRKSYAGVYFVADVVQAAPWLLLLLCLGVMVMVVVLGQRWKRTTRFPKPKVD